MLIIKLPLFDTAREVIGISCPLKNNYLFLSFISSTTIIPPIQYIN